MLNCDWSIPGHYPGPDLCHGSQLSMFKVSDQIRSRYRNRFPRGGGVSCLDRFTRNCSDGPVFLHQLFWRVKERVDPPSEDIIDSDTQSDEGQDDTGSWHLLDNDLDSEDCRAGVWSCIMIWIDLYLEPGASTNVRLTTCSYRFHKLHFYHLCHHIVTLNRL